MGNPEYVSGCLFEERTLDIVESTRSAAQELRSI